MYVIFIAHWLLSQRGTQNRAKPGPEYFGYSGEVYVLTPVMPDGRETDLRKLSRAEFEQRLETLLSDGEAWTVYLNFRMVGRDTGVLVRFDGSGRVAGVQTWPVHSTHTSSSG